MTRLTRITPFVPCTDMERQIHFYTGVLMFEPTFVVDDYAFLKWQDIAVRLIQCPPRQDGEAVGHEHSYYIDVEDVDALYDTLKSRLGDLPPDRVRAPFNQHYGQRELHVLDADGSLIFFGQAITG